MSQDPKQNPESPTSEDADAGGEKPKSSFFDTTMPGVDPESEAWKARVAPDSSKENWRRADTMTKGWQDEATMVDQPAVRDDSAAIDPAFQEQATLMDAGGLGDEGTKGWEGADQVTMTTRRAVDADQFQEQATMVGVDGEGEDPQPVNPPPGSSKAPGILAGVGAPTEGMEPVSARILGDFRLDRKLGQGGMGEVYLATQISLDREVAVKLLPSSLVTQPKFIERFEREAKSAASLSHANIIQVYAFGIVDECPYFAMEYVEGEDLHERLLRAGRLPLSEIIELMIGVGSALGAAGDKGLVHRDIKPSNVMIDRFNNVKVMDFGLAKATSMAGASLTQSGLIMGTPNYMSPEQARGDEVDRRSDIYSLGIVFYEMLTQQLPFRADTPAGLIFKHVYEQPEAPRVKNQDIPAFLEEVVLRMIEKDPDKRYNNAHEFVKDLKEFRNNQSYYLDGGERRDDSALTDSSSEVATAPPAPPISDSIDPSSLATAPLQGPPTVVVNTGGGGQVSAWLRFFLIMFGLGLLGFGILYFGHTQRSWTVPGFDKIDNWLVSVGFKSKEPSGGNGGNGGVGVITTATPTPTKTSVKLTYSRALPAGVTAQWNGFAEGGERFEPLNNGTYEVEPATYIVKYSKAGYQDLDFVVKVSKDGAKVLESERSINEVPLNFEPTAPLALAYQGGVKGIAAGEYDEAIAELENAAKLDPEYRREGGPSVKELIEKARDLKAKQATRESEGAAVLAAAQKKIKAKDWKGALAELEKMPDTSSKAKDGEALEESINTRLAEWTQVISAAGAALRKGELEPARESLAAIVAEDPLEQTRARAELDRVLSAKALLAEAEKERDAGFAGFAARDLKVGQARLLSAQRAYEKYLKEYAGADAARRKDFEAINSKLLEGKNLDEQISAMNKAYDSNKVETALDLANQILANDPKNPSALEIRRLSIETLNDVKITKALKDLDRALTGEDPSAALAFIDRRSSALYQRTVDELRAFADIGRFAKSEHTYRLDDLKFETLELARLTVRWRFAIRFLEVDRTIEAERVLKITMELDSGAWKITEISR